MSKTASQRVMNDVDTAAAAIAREDGHDWGGMLAQERRWRDSIMRYRAMAGAAIDALKLTEELRTNAMSSAGMTADSRTGETTFTFDIRYDRRLLGPWQPA